MLTLASCQFPLEFLDLATKLPDRVLKENKTLSEPASSDPPRTAHKTYLEHFTDPPEVRELHLQVLLHLPGKGEGIGRLPLPALQMAASPLVQHDLSRRVAIGRGDRKSVV